MTTDQDTPETLPPAAAETPTAPNSKGKTAGTKKTAAKTASPRTEATQETPAGTDAASAASATVAAKARSKPAPKKSAATPKAKPSPAASASTKDAAAAPKAKTDAKASAKASAASADAAEAKPAKKAAPRAGSKAKAAAEATPRTAGRASKAATTDDKAADSAAQEAPATTEKSPKTAKAKDAPDKARTAQDAVPQSSPPALASAAPVAGAAPAPTDDAPAAAAPDTVASAPRVAAASEHMAAAASEAPVSAAPAHAATTAAPELTPPAEAPASDDDAPRRKNRRGRRGGRGRNRKKEGNGADTAALNDQDNAQDGHNSHDPATAEDQREAGRPEADQPEMPEAEASEPEAAQPETAPRSPAPRGKQPKAEGKSGKAVAKGKETLQGRQRMFISVLPGEQVEVALSEDGQLLEYYLEMLHQRKIKGNIYKAVIHNIDTNLQAAFVSYGSGKNGFLQIDEVHPEYWLAHHEPAKGKKFPPIQKVLKPGQEVLVQVVKEPTGSKGAFLTTWLSLAGRFLVLTPGQEQTGVSRKVDDEERGRLREMMTGIDPGQGLGVIVRTVSAGTTKTTLRNDLQYLKRVWRDIRKKGTEVTAPALIYQEPGLSERAVRDYLTEDVAEIWVDNEDVAQNIRETVSLLFPRKEDLVRVHTDLRTPMWERFNLRRQLDQVYTREALLPSGGRLVFDQTEALMAIDINSGKISGKGNFEAMAHKTNMEAAEAIARHLKLRDIGGQVVIDFIEMREKKHVLEVEKTLRTAMKNDRARHDVGRMSAFGLLELVRQRTGSSALAITMEPCPACGGTGMRRNIEWQALQALRELRRQLRAETKEKCVFAVPSELALYLLNHKRDSLREMEQDYGKCLEISVRP